LGQALNLTERSVNPYTSHLRIFGCEAYVRIPEEDSEYIKARKTKERSRVGAFVGTEGLRGHIYVIWVPEKGRLFRSRDVKFREGGEYVPKDWSAILKNKEETRTYRAMIPGNKKGKTEERENLNIEPKPAGVDPERSATPAGYRYNTPDSINGVAGYIEESDPEEWYPADIQQDDFEEQIVPEEQIAPEEQDSLEEQENEPEKPKKSQSRKRKESQQPTRSSSRVTKGQNNNSFAKEHYLTYVSFVAAQIAKQFVPQSLKQAIEGPEKDMWLEACKKQLAKIENKKSWELCDLPEGQKVLPTKWVFDPKKRARLVVCGNFEKKTDVETFAAVVNMTMVKLFFLVVAVKDWECYQYDFEAAFLNGEMKTRSVYVRQPPGFGDRTNRVYKLLKTLYGLRDSPLI
jgi:hypothetical protein